MMSADDYFNRKCALLPLEFTSLVWIAEKPFPGGSSSLPSSSDCSFWQHSHWHSGKWASSSERDPQRHAPRIVSRCSERAMPHFEDSSTIFAHGHTKREVCVPIPAHYNFTYCTSSFFVSSAIDCIYCSYLLISDS